MAVQFWKHLFHWTVPRCCRICTAITAVTHIRCTLLLVKKLCEKQWRKHSEKLVLLGVCKWQGLDLTVWYFLKLTSLRNLRSILFSTKLLRGKRTDMTRFDVWVIGQSIYSCGLSASSILKLRRAEMEKESNSEVLWLVSKSWCKDMRNWKY